LNGLKDENQADYETRNTESEAVQTRRFRLGKIRRLRLCVFGESQEKESNGYHFVGNSVVEGFSNGLGFSWWSESEKLYWDGEFESNLKQLNGKKKLKRSKTPPQILATAQSTSSLSTKNVVWRVDNGLINA
jgi:hypothetical protein